MIMFVRNLINLFSSELVIIIIICFTRQIDGISEHFVTQLCPGSIGPAYGEVLRFDPLSNQNKWAVPSKDIDCWITFRGRPTSAGSPQRKSTLTWRSSPFSWRGASYGTGSNNSASSSSSSSTSACSTAYIEIFNATNDGRYISPAAIGPICGVVSPGEFTTVSQSIVIHFYALAPASALDVVEKPPNTTASSNSLNNNETVTEAPFLGPYLNFTADLTSYFEGSCSADGIENDRDQLQCYNQRCIHISLRCDVYFSDNCGDYGDVRASPPGNCTFTGTTTEKPNEEEDELLPLWIILGILGGLLLLAACIWCCWRPGFLCWRLWRLRNVFCGPCKRLCCSSTCCRACSNGCCGPRNACYKNCCNCCTGREKDAAVLAASGAAMGTGNSKFNNNDDDMDKGGNEWMKFSNGDGAHVRELR